MMIKIICIGKLKETFLVDGINEYKKRIEGFQKLQILELKEYNTSDISKNIENEGFEILEKVNSDEHIITLEILGKKLDSITFSRYLENQFTYGTSKITFIIGGSNGLSEEVKKRSNFRLSFSDMTFPHQLMRLILMEQLYRALTIIHHKEYHK
ncbi:MAG: 23S rRNA (pseudouridine(1915)-N(3))-methyltransferase RlmH [Bacilli bacterium]|jgi:ribosomal RNA large subunit methyltransferase H|nr:23S rRNA (pseudouridine(1915)-N(3))-methyltransferase RlmH [Staphylococcus sp.]